MDLKLHDGPAKVSLSTPDERILVQFMWSGDRFVHQIYIDGTDGQAATSIADGGTEDWPSSPPLQQLSEEVIDGRPVVLGIGLAGRSHWSVVVQSVQTETGYAMKFEWACRHKDKPNFVGSTYASTAFGHTTSLKIIASGNAKLIQRDPNTLVIEPNPACDTGTDVWSYTVS